MLYFLVKIPVRLALRIFCRDIKAGAATGTDRKGPLLITANHPNSFLDAIIIGSRFSRPVYFLARGDAFRKSWHNRLLRLLNMIPIYRMSEGKENLPRNADAFERCKKVLSRNGIVLIFIEGISVNSHELQPFKKGAARIAIENRHLPGFCILPLGISYSSLSGIGKRVRIQTAETIETDTVLPYNEEAKNMRYFNERLFALIRPCIDTSFLTAKSRMEVCFLLLPAMIGYIINAPFYYLIQNLVARKTKGTIFYDSVLFASLFCIYPPYVLLLCLFLWMLAVPVWMVAFLFVLHPLTAWAAVRVFSGNTK